MIISGECLADACIRIYFEDFDNSLKKDKKFSEIKRSKGDSGQPNKKDYATINSITGKFVVLCTFNVNYIFFLYCLQLPSQSSKMANKRVKLLSPWNELKFQSCTCGSSD